MTETVSLPASTSHRVLVVDDDEANRVTLERILSREGLSVVHAASGREGLEHLRETPVDLILTDLKMPGMSGIDLLKASKHLEPDLEVVVNGGIRSVGQASRFLDRLDGVVGGPAAPHLRGGPGSARPDLLLGRGQRDGAPARPSPRPGRGPGAA